MESSSYRWQPSPTATEQRKVPVVYYLSRNNQLEHPHFVEVPLSSPEGLFLRDVISRLHVVRGQGMPAMYSWSCKRSYKSGFVWHDLGEDDLVMPAAGDEYVLKGSELLDQKPPAHSSQDQVLIPSGIGRCSASSLSPSPPCVISEEAKPLHPHPSPSIADDIDGTLNLTCRSPVLQPWRSASFDTGGYPGSTDLRVRKASLDISETCTRGVSTDSSSADVEATKFPPRWSPNLKERAAKSPAVGTPSEASLPRARTESLESLMRAEPGRRCNFRQPQGEEPVGLLRLRPANLLMQLITCGAISVKEFRRSSYTNNARTRNNSRIRSHPAIRGLNTKCELALMRENAKLIGLKLEDREYFSGSIVEAQRQMEASMSARRATLKRSSSYNFERSDRMLNSDESRALVPPSRCFPRPAKLAIARQAKSDRTIKSPLSDGSRNSSVGPGSSRRLANGQSTPAKMDSFRKEKQEKLVLIEERLPSGAMVTIQSRVPC